LELVILFQIIGAAYWGWDALDARRTNTRLEGIGSGDTLNSNLLGAHLLTIIPLTIIIALMKEPRWQRVTAIISAPFIVNLLILCNSRGATVGFVMAGLASFVLVRKGLRKRVLVGATVGGLALYLLADPQFITRQQTITDPTDASATSRLSIWAGSLRMVNDYPFGAGGRGFHILSPRYVPELQEQGSDGRSAHNMYIQIAADWGVQGLILFVAFAWYVLLLLHRVRRERLTADRVYFLSLGLELGLIGTLVAAFFSVRFYGESIYWICGLSTALYCMTSAEKEAERVDAGTSRAAA
jgi:O-antigen ligase